MADRTITQLTVTTSAAAGDEIPIWVAASSVTRKITKANFMGGVLTGAGTVATGGFTLTVPATGTAALLGTANTFTQDITITKASGFAAVILNAIDNGSSNGNRVLIGRNLNASTPAAGTVAIENLGGSTYRIWPDTSGNIRTLAGNVTNANDTGGTVVGTQTSMAEAKNLYDDLTPISEVLAGIQQAAAAAVRRFTYKSGSFNGEQFEGVVTDLAPRYGMDRDAEHPAGKSLNEITLLGDLLRAVAYLVERVERVERLEK